MTQHKSVLFMLSHPLFAKLYFLYKQFLFGSLFFPFASYTFLICVSLFDHPLLCFFHGMVLSLDPVLMIDSIIWEWLNIKFFALCSVILSLQNFTVCFCCFLLKLFNLLYLWIFIWSPTTLFSIIWYCPQTRIWWSIQ